MNKGYKILSVVACALLTLGMTSCEKEMSGTDGHHYPILFTCDDIDTRAANIATNADLQYYGFHVWGFYQTGTPNANNQIENGNFFEFNGHVIHNNGIYGFEDVTEYWWVGDYEFIAMYPDPSDSDAFTATFEMEPGVDEMQGVVTYEDITKQVDLLYTEASAFSRNVGGVVGPLDDFGEISKTSLPLTFIHLLSKINIQLKSEIAATIESITLNDITKGGEITLNRDVINDWTSFEYFDYTYTCNPAVTVDAKQTTAKPITDKNGILVIPGKQQGFTITITTTEKTYTSEVIEANWVMGNEYTYTATLKQQNIVFAEPEVAEWDHESATGSVIIK